MDRYVLTVLTVAVLAALFGRTECKARVCYFGSLPEPDSGHPDWQHWATQAVRLVRERCPRAVECSDPMPLGMEDGTIPDDHIRASSGDHLKGRFNNADGSWVPCKDSYENSWIEADLGVPTTVSGVVSIGSTTWSWRVTMYRVAYRTPHTTGYDYVRDYNGEIKVFDGNIDAPRTPVLTFFPKNLIATVVRIEPVAWISGIALRFELVSC